MHVQAGGGVGARWLLKPFACLSMEPSGLTWAWGPGEEDADAPPDTHPSKDECVVFTWHPHPVGASPGTKAIESFRNGARSSNLG